MGFVAQTKFTVQGTKMVDLDALQKMYDQRMNHSGSIVWREEITAQFPALVAHIKSIEAQLGEARGLRAAYAALDADENEETEQAFIDALDSFDLAIARPESTPPAEPAPTVERRAKEIYESWKDQNGYVPWVERGNSLIQDEARTLAALEQSTVAPSEKIK